MQIHLAYQNIDAYLLMVPTHAAPKRYYRTTSGQDIQNIRTPLFDTTQARAILETLPDLSTQLKTTNREIDLDLVGKLIYQTKQVVVDDYNQPIYDFREIDQLIKPDGSIQTRPHKKYNPTVNTKIPVLITDQFYSATELITKFIFRKSYHLFHKDGVTYRFAFDLAKQLSTQKHLARVQAFEKEKTPGPLVLYYGGLPFAAAFLEGQIKQNQYSLILHLADRELHLPSNLTQTVQSESEVEA